MWVCAHVCVFAWTAGMISYILSLHQTCNSWWCFPRSPKYSMAFYFLDLSFYNDLHLVTIFVPDSLGHNLDTDLRTLCSLHKLPFKFLSCFFPAYISLMIPWHYWAVLFTVLCIFQPPSTSLLSLCTPLRFHDLVSQSLTHTQSLFL